MATEKATFWAIEAMVNEDGHEHDASQSLTRTCEREVREGNGGVAAVHLGRGQIG